MTFPILQWWTQEKPPQENELVFPGLPQCLWDSREIGSGPCYSEPSTVLGLSGQAQAIAILGRAGSAVSQLWLNFVRWQLCGSSWAP